jgi:hypothetical protein
MPTEVENNTELSENGPIAEVGSEIEIDDQLRSFRESPKA